MKHVTNIKYTKYLLLLSIGAFSAVAVGLLSLNLTPPTDNSQAATSTFATGPATISISTSPEAIAFGEVSGGSATKTQAVTVTSTSVAGYTLSQNFGDSAATQTSATSGTTTAKWVTSGALTKNGGTATIPVALSHSFNVANEDQHDFTYSVTVTDAQHMPAGVYSGKSVYTAVANLPATPTNLKVSPSEYKIGSTNKKLTITADSGLSSAYSVYIGDTAQKCTIDTTAITDKQITCTIPDTITKGEYAVYVVTQASSTPYEAGKLTVTKPCYFSTTATAGNGDTLQVDYDCNMIPVKYTGDTTMPQWTVADPTSANASDWFSYDSTKKQWANVVTVKKDALTKYSTAGDVEKSGQAPAKGYYKAGTAIDNNDVLGYFVYIPRYAYEVQRRDATDKFVSDSAGSGFDIHFETTSTPKSTPAAGCSTLSGSTLTAKDYRTECGINRTYHGGTTTDGVYAATTWATHPAFTWGKAELNGFWMGKFETTGKISAPTIKPNQVANVNNTIGQQFTSAASIGVDDPTADTMGSTVNGITKNGHNMSTAKSHMLKSSEWGAATYLSASNYGAGVNNVLNNGAYNHKSRRDTNAVNSDADGNSASTWGGAATGCGTSSESDTYSSNGYYFPQHTTTLNATTLQYSDGMDGGSVCETSSTDITHAYNQSLGVKASTTNNVYGVYDMAGGMDEYVMGNLTYSTGQSTSKASYVANPIKSPYLDLYNTSDGFGNKPSWSSKSSDTGEWRYNNDVCTWTTCGGQALHETKRVQSVSSNGQSWGSDYSLFPYRGFPWDQRGGRADDRSYAGLFAADGVSRGDSHDSYAFRVSLVPTSQ